MHKPSPEESKEIACLINLLIETDEQLDKIQHYCTQHNLDLEKSWIETHEKYLNKFIHYDHHEPNPQKIEKLIKETEILSQTLTPQNATQGYGASFALRDWLEVKMSDIEDEFANPQLKFYREAVENLEDFYIACCEANARKFNITNKDLDQISSEAEFRQAESLSEYHLSKVIIIDPNQETLCAQSFNPRYITSQIDYHQSKSLTLRLLGNIENTKCYAIRLLSNERAVFFLQIKGEMPWEGNHRTTVPYTSNQAEERNSLHKPPSKKMMH